MAQTISDVMTTNPTTLDSDSTVLQAASAMSSQNVGDIIILSSGQISGILTDRDIVIRCIAEGLDPARTTCGQICTNNPTTVSPSTSTGDAVRLMSQHAIRRLPVVQNNQPVGVVSIGDLAIELDSSSALADISAAPPSS
jgi:CBS domain-containing protein